MIEGISGVTLGTHEMPRASDSTARWSLRSCMAAKSRPSPAFEQERAILTSSPSLPSGAGPGGGGYLDVWQQRGHFSCLPLHDRRQLRTVKFRHLLSYPMCRTSHRRNSERETC
jgi:hypothetical protein